MLYLLVVESERRLSYVDANVYWNDGNYGHGWWEALSIVVLYLAVIVNLCDV